jgi:murein DD-endopeptidase MepM/ murein hydrolase activator NlpD
MQNEKNILKFLSSLLALFLLIIACPQEKKEELASQRELLLKEIDYTSKLLNETEEKKSVNIEKVQLLSKKILKRWELIRLYEIQINELNEKIYDRERSIKMLERELKTQKDAYAGFILYSYKNYDNYTKGLYLLASKDLNQLYLRKKYMEQLSLARKDKISLIKKLKLKIQSEINVLIKEKLQKEASLNAIQKEHAQLASEKISRERQIKALASEERRLKQLIEEKKRIEKEIATKIEELIKAEAKKGTKTKLTPEQVLISKDFEGNRGRLPWPIRQGVITEHFGEQNHPVIKDLVVRNSGIDIATNSGENARSIFDGEVSKIFAIKGANYTVIIKHGSYYSVYHNLYDVKVNVGDKVKTKDIIGKVSKNSSGDAGLVHFELWKGLEKLNPEDWISH